MQKKLKDYLLKKSKEMIKLFGIVFFLFLIIPAFYQVENYEQPPIVVLPVVTVDTPGFAGKGDYKEDSVQLLHRFKRLERTARKAAMKLDSLEVIRVLHWIKELVERPKVIRDTVYLAVPDFSKIIYNQN